MSTQPKYYKISGKKDGKRLPSRVVEEIIQNKVKENHRYLEIEAFGQHGVGGRLWRAGNEEVNVRITGHSGQRTGSFGFPNTKIEIMGTASDDIGWLNAGAEIIVHGHASNGVMNGAAQGQVYIAGSIGARGMTMTKHNPRFSPPELWILGSTGDFFGEFMAGGIAIICNHESQNPSSALGYRPFVGMVAGKAFVRGGIEGFSENDALIAPISDEEWEWLLDNLKIFLSKINKDKLIDSLANRSDWTLLRAKTQQEKLLTGSKTSMASFRANAWDKELGDGGLFGDILDSEQETCPIITSGEMRRLIPVWENKKYKAPCEAACPTCIPVQDRWHLVRSDQLNNALTKQLEYTPFPATVCGYLCPNPCMDSCTRNEEGMIPIDIKVLNQITENAKLPTPKEKNGKTVAVIGAGVAGISSAWHLTLKGYSVTLFDENKEIGGKISSVIPESRFSKTLFKNELNRVTKLIPDIVLEKKIDASEFKKIKNKFDFAIIAAGASKPRMLPIEGIEKADSALEFLTLAKKDRIKPGKDMVIIGAGNVGCDVATQAHRLGAKNITLIDVQKPAAFGAEKRDAEECGAKFKWPCFTEKITDKGVLLNNGELIKADSVVVSIGDEPELSFLGSESKGSIATDKNFISTDNLFATSDPKVFAIGDVVEVGLLTDAIGMGKKCAVAIDSPDQVDLREKINTKRITLEYFSPLANKLDGLDDCAAQCASCGTCRDCGICISICPEGAIFRNELDEKSEYEKPFKVGFEYISDAEKCIGCGFCAGACPCGIWDIVPYVL
jgi:NADPH-dependent glutamate synthase beta subunit-like oxidoreductase/glutamate synthase domain-containing protein 3/NAD-dependent dihydropyrimidine dehydrogenase PreA subunit